MSNRIIRSGTDTGLNWKAVIFFHSPSIYFTDRHRLVNTQTGCSKQELLLNKCQKSNIINRLTNLASNSGEKRLHSSESDYVILQAVDYQTSYCVSRWQIIIIIIIAQQDFAKAGKVAVFRQTSNNSAICHQFKVLNTASIDRKENFMRKRSEDDFSVCTFCLTIISERR